MRWNPLHKSMINHFAFSKNQGTFDQAIEVALSGVKPHEKYFPFSLNFLAAIGL